MPRDQTVFFLVSVIGNLWAPNGKPILGHGQVNRLAEVGKFRWVNSRLRAFIGGMIRKFKEGRSAV